MRRLADRLAGIRAAFVAPDWIEQARLGSLTAAPSETPAVPLTAPAPTEATDFGHLRTRSRGQRPDRARRAAWLTLRVLARLRPGRWRTTCLYRSVAECLALRALGVPCHVELSAGRHPDTGLIEAHAVVRLDGVPEVDDTVDVVDGIDGADAGFRTPFRPAGASVRGGG